jgi:hypothetical protein
MYDLNAVDSRESAGAPEHEAEMITSAMKSAGARIIASAFEYAGCDDPFTLRVAERVFAEMVAAR